ncbi:TM2 domain-containing protein [Aneurinibacillus thermoaerophilus]|uniref:TM2 domain-containing membrane protein YozV n=1 Tax=Aneurinibacillus thermoaerophilus TaxID=143495 RepID=A0A1G8FRW6_ANETH|nr:TM2 domain-containing protein [Aneurinibacillus thermoaerophilus]MED0739031.1 TM2 domain-containing protein [Aneurinibacillus thermoaerophilus]MED0757573.1 TM2 domain-containing protein [Aneurinibacillus thermoaerophilus]MED0760622.1 TM2 domain-containing protein [Aneurinibacillus thermoaerophilus]QYY42508.1 TM2 domain-containing protein [Aneurinibacillus thermoaerophilus]SDH84872.1 TM2 domain-containing membrane protein YozV [Aneurinibacillus thermoaerophilus]
MDNLIARQELNTEQQLMINAEFEKRKKSKGIAYILWLFLGSLGGHRFYAGDIGLGIGMIIVWVLGWFIFFIPTIIWAIIDLFLIGKRIDQLNEQIEAEIINKVKMLKS